MALASIARDDPSPLPDMHRDHNALPSQTDGQTDTDIVAMYTLHLALKIKTRHSTREVSIQQPSYAGAPEY